jgi:hypothetical protein
MAGCGGSRRLGCSGSPRWLLLAVVRLGSDLGPYEHGRPRFFMEVFDAMAALWNFLGDEDCCAACWLSPASPCRLFWWIFGGMGGGDGRMHGGSAWIKAVALGSPRVKTRICLMHVLLDLVGVLVHAFYIINIVTYMINFEWYLPWSIIIYVFLVDLWNFPTKSLYWYLVSGRQKTSFFLFCCFRGTFWTPKIKGKKYVISFSSSERPWAKEAWEGIHEGQTRPGGVLPSAGRTTQAHSGLERRLGPSFL